MTRRAFPGANDLNLEIFSCRPLVGISNVFVSISPCCVESSLHVGSFVGVASEEVTLSLCEARRQSLTPVGVEVRKGAAQGRTRNTIC